MNGIFDTISDYYNDVTSSLSEQMEQAIKAIPAKIRELSEQYARLNVINNTKPSAESLRLFSDVNERLATLLRVANELRDAFEFIGYTEGVQIITGQLSGIDPDQRYLIDLDSKLSDGQKEALIKNVFSENDIIRQENIAKLEQERAQAVKDDQEAAIVLKLQQSVEALPGRIATLNQYLNRLNAVIQIKAYPDALALMDAIREKVATLTEIQSIVNSVKQSGPIEIVTPIETPIVEPVIDRSREEISRREGRLAGGHLGVLPLAAAAGALAALSAAGISAAVLYSIVFDDTVEEKVISFENQLIEDTNDLFNQGEITASERDAIIKTAQENKRAAIEAAGKPILGDVGGSLMTIGGFILGGFLLYQFIGKK